MKTNVNTDDIRALAETARIELDDGMAESLKGDIAAILEYAARLDGYLGDSETSEATSDTSEREDLPAEPYARDKMLRNAPDTENGYLRLPCVLPSSETEAAP